MNEELDFWQEAQSFLKSVLSDDYETKFIEYAKSKNLTPNEVRLFGAMISDYISFENTMGMLKGNLIGAIEKSN